MDVFYRAALPVTGRAAAPIPVLFTNIAHSKNNPLSVPVTSYT